MREYVFDGNKFNSPKTFFKYSEGILTYELSWETGRNLNAFNDLLHGGFGRHDAGEIIKVKWINMGKSRKKLNSDFYEALIDVLEKAENVIFERFEYK
jgi:RNAse (barnase) inhibitor barstar